MWWGRLRAAAKSRWLGQLGRLGQGLLVSWYPGRLRDQGLPGELRHLGQLRHLRQALFVSRAPGHVRGQVLPDWSGQLDQGALAGFFAPKEAVAHLGQVRHLGQVSVAGLLALAHLRHLRQLGQVFLPQACCSRQG